MQAAVPSDRRDDRAAPESLRDKALLHVAVTSALTALQEGRNADAIAALQPHEASAVVQPAQAYVFGLIHFNAGAAPPALGWFERCIALQPDHAEALLGRAVLLQRLGRGLEALEGFTAVQKLKPNDAEAFHLGALALQGLGRHDEALAAFEHALRLEPDHAEALGNCGALLDELGRLEAALACFDKAAALRPDDRRALFNRGAVLQRLGRPAEALAAYDAAEAAPATGPHADTADAELALNRGNVLQKLGRPAEALAAYDDALRRKSPYAQAHYNRGIALQASGRLGDALAAYDDALAALPTYAEAACNRGNTLSALGRHDEALTSYDKALRLKPDLPQALVNRANLLLRLGHAAQAIEACDMALRHAPDSAMALCIKGAALEREKRYEDALDALDAALALAPDYPEALQNKGNVLQGLGDHATAIEHYDRALRARPDFPEALSSRGVARKECGAVEAALVDFDAALRLKPDYPDARNNRAGALLLLGRLEEGFRDFEARWDRTDAPSRAFVSSLPLWSGEPLAGKKIVVWDEQGLGDLIQFCRYLPLLRGAGADVTFMGRGSMHRLLASLPGVPPLVERITGHEAFDYQVPLLSLPRGFGTSLGTIPAVVPYLAADPERRAFWRERIGSHGFRVGLCNHGRAGINLGRSVPFAALSAVAALPGVRLISLMQHADPPAPPDLPLELLREGPDDTFDAGPASFLETAAAIAELDLVITSDTAIAHLAGALGRPVFVALRFAADWRWLTDRDDSPWYPTMRLFRQAAPGEWNDVFARMATAIAPLASGAREPVTIALPSGVGDLVDRLTILDIKAVRIDDPAKLANVHCEQALLRGVKEGLATAPALVGLETALKAVNEMLWDVEDALRVHESAGDFGPAFVALARQVYKTNDRRAALKKEINLLLGSTIVEEKSYGR